MAHFAELDSNNTVLRVLVVSNDDILDASGVEQEALGIAYLKNLFGEDSRWVQTSYSASFRGCYAGPGMSYDPEADLFFAPLDPVRARDEFGRYLPDNPETPGINEAWVEATAS